MKQYPGEFDFKRRPGESKDAYMLRMMETNSQTTKFNWAPWDGRGVSDTRQTGCRFPKNKVGRGR